jgi:hypothetical protein
MLKLLNRAGHKETREELKDAVMAMHKELAEAFERERGRDAACARRVQRAEAEARELREHVAGLEIRAAVCAGERDRLRAQLADALAAPMPEPKDAPMPFVVAPPLPPAALRCPHEEDPPCTVEPSAASEPDADDDVDANQEAYEAGARVRPSLTAVYDLDGFLTGNTSVGEGLIALVATPGTLVVGVTDGPLEGLARAFWAALPLEARISGRCLLFCDTCMLLYRSNALGEPVEDESYGPFPGNTKRYLRQATVGSLVSEARAGLKQWFKELNATPALLADQSHFLHGLASQWMHEDAPVTSDPARTPRVELRGEKGALFYQSSGGDRCCGCAVVGVPVALSDKYLTSRLAAHPDLRAHVQGRPVHNRPVLQEGPQQALALRYEATVPGLSKVILDPGSHP